MAERKNEVAAEEIETVSKAEYDKLLSEYRRMSSAYNKAVSIIAGNYAEKISQSIFSEVDKELG